MKDIKVGFNKPKALLKFSLISLMVITGLAGCQSTHIRKIPPLPVETASVVSGNLPITVTVLGQAIPVQSVTVTPQASGTLEKVYVRSGQWVTKGQRLFQIDPAMYVAQVAQDEANLQGEIAQAHYDELQVLSYKPLVAKNYVTLQTYQQAQAAAETANAGVSADQAALAEAQLNLSYTHITAPISGQIGLLTIKTGSLVAANTTNLTTINQTRPIKIQFSLPEKDLNNIRQALMTKKDAVKVYSESRQELLGTGPITAIDNSISSSSGTISVQATLANKKKLIWSNEYVQVIFTKKHLDNVFIIPSLALQEGEKGPYVYIIKDHKAVMLPVVFLGENGSRTAVSGDVHPGEKVIIGAPARLRPGALVAPLSSTSSSKVTNKAR